MENSCPSYSVVERVRGRSRESGGWLPPLQKFSRQTTGWCNQNLSKSFFYRIDVRNIILYTVCLFVNDNNPEWKSARQCHRAVTLATPVISKQRRLVNERSQWCSDASWIKRRPNKPQIWATFCRATQCTAGARPSVVKTLARSFKTNEHHMKLHQ